MVNSYTALTDKRKISIMPVPHPVNAGAGPNQTKPEWGPVIIRSGSQTPIFRKFAGFLLFSIFLASIVPYARIEILNFQNGE